MKAITSRLLLSILIIFIVFTSASLSFGFSASNNKQGKMPLPQLRTSGKKRPKIKEIPQAKLQSGKDVGTIAWSEITGGPKHIRGPITAPSQDDPETIILRFLEEKKVLYGITDPYQDIYKIKSDTCQETGYTTIHFGQIYKGVPVENRLVISVASNGVISSISGVYYPDIEVDVNPTVSAKEAKAIALSHELNYGSPFDKVPEGMESRFLHPSPPIDAKFMKAVQPELLIWPTGDKDYLLWHFYTNRWSYYVDAHNGEIQGVISRTYFVSGFVDATGYVLQEPNWDQNQPVDPNVVVNFRLYYDEPNNKYVAKDDLSTGSSLVYTLDWFLGEGTSYTPNVPSDPNDNNIWVSAHYYTRMATKFYMEQYGRNGHDDNGTQLIVCLSYPFIDYKTHTVNGDFACFDPINFGVPVILLGDGKSGVRRNYAGSIDCIAHEFSHGVSDALHGEPSDNEPASLYESFSDMMGCAVEYWLATTVDKFANTFDWYIAEDITISDPLSGKPYMKNMADPPDTNQPDTYPSGDPNTSTEGGWMPLSDPNYDEHINAGVPNKMFYLLSEGGTHNGVQVQGIGILNAAYLMYQANKRKWQASTGFLGARQGCIDEALEWDANHATAWADSVQNAWAAVNVGDPIGDIYEPDGSIDHARVIEFDVQQLHSLKPASDHDWMTFTLNETTSVWIETSGPSGDTRMWLRDSQGNEIEYDDDDGNGNFSKIIRSLSPGTYYIEIDEYGNNHEIPTYYVDLINKADLIIYNMQVWDYYGAPYLRYGWPVSIRVATRNQGSLAAGTFSTGLYINTSPYSTPFWLWNISGLNPGSLVNSYTNVTFWVTGWQYLNSRADISFSVEEKYEDNNVCGPLWIYIYPY